MNVCLLGLPLLCRTCCVGVNIYSGIMNRIISSQIHSWSLEIVFTTLISLLYSASVLHKGQIRVHSQLANYWALSLWGLLSSSFLFVEPYPFLPIKLKHYSDLPIASHNDFRELLSWIIMASRSSWCLSHHHILSIKSLGMAVLISSLNLNLHWEQCLAIIAIIQLTCDINVSQLPVGSLICQYCVIHAGSIYWCVYVALLIPFSFLMLTHITHKWVQVEGVHWVQSLEVSG